MLKIDECGSKAKDNGIIIMRNADGNHEGNLRRGGEKWVDLKSALK